MTRRSPTRECGHTWHEALPPWDGDMTPKIGAHRHACYLTITAGNDTHPTVHKCDCGTTQPESGQA